MTLPARGLDFGHRPRIKPPPLDQPRVMSPVFQVSLQAVDVPAPGRTSSC